MNKTYIIIYVDDLDKTKMFYEILFDIKPIVDEPGMCELELPNNITLGIMPNSSFEKLFGEDYIFNEKKKSSHCWICTDLQNSESQKCQRACNRRCRGI